MYKITLIFVLFCSFTNGQNQKINPDNPGTTKTGSYLEQDWRKLSQNGNFVDAASELLYLTLSDSTRNRHADFWHIGQIYAQDNQYQKAIFYLKKSMKDHTEMDDKQYWWYYKGTLAFLQKDKERLEKFSKLLGENHTNYYSNNAKVLKSLLNNFDKPYFEAIRN